VRLGDGGWVLQSPYFFQQGSGRLLVNEGDRVDLPAPAADLVAADDFVDWPVAAFDQDFRPAVQNALERRVLIEPGDQCNASQRGHDGQAIVEAVDWAIIAFAQALYRSIGIQSNNQTVAERGSLGEIGDVTAMQDVEASVGEYQRAGKRGAAFGKPLRRTDFRLEGGWSIGHRCGQKMKQQAF